MRPHVRRQLAGIRERLTARVTHQFLRKLIWCVSMMQVCAFKCDLGDDDSMMHYIGRCIGNVTHEMKYIEAISVIIPSKPSNLHKLEQYINTLSDIDEKDDKFGRTLLRIAAGSGEPSGLGSHVVEYLIEKGADVNIVDKNYQSLMCVAAHTGCVEIARALVDVGVATETPYFYPPHRYPPLYEARHYPKMMKYLIDVGCNPHHRHRGNSTLLMDVAEIGETECVRVLLDAGVNPNSKMTAG